MIFGSTKHVSFINADVVAFPAHPHPPTQVFSVSVAAFGFQFGMLKQRTILLVSEKKQEDASVREPIMPFRLSFIIVAHLKVT